MEFMNSLGVLMGGSWASGVNLYLTTGGIRGLAQNGLDYTSRQYGVVG